ncbi:MAG: hypothetical protein NVSMB18_36330 [Acetobacteraceae bacterium]
MLAAALGTEFMAVLGVVTGFFGGLALGALLLDRPIRTGRSARRAYAALETIIGVWALASIWLLPAAGRMLAVALGPTPPPPLLWAAGFAVPALLLLPATAAMGGTLIALERLVGSLRGGGRVASGVYGANTAGAMAGCFACVFLLMPLLGLAHTLAALALVNALCAIGALALDRSGDAPARAAVAPALGDARLLLTLAGTGFLGIALEILVIRLAAQLLQNTIYSFAALLGAYLLGTALGGLLWQRTRRPPGPTALAALLAAASVTTLLTAAVIRWLGPVALEAGLSSLTSELLVAMLLFLAPTAAMGALFGCLAQALRDRRGSLGRAVGSNALGAAAAPAVTTLLLMPALGSATALLVVGLAYLLLIPLPVRRLAAFAAAPLALAALLTLWPSAPLIRIPPGGALLETREGPAATASAVVDAGGIRYLEVNGHFRMGGTSSQRSDWRQAQIPLLLHPDPHRALFLGVGTGATLAGAAALPGLDVTGVELVPDVVRLLPWFADPAVPPIPPIVVADARRFVLAAPGNYDVIVADLFHPALDGTGGLYSTEHFTAVRARLAEGGVFCQWLPLYQLDQPSLRAILRAFLSVYPDGTAWLAHFSLQTPMLALVGTRAGQPLDLTRLRQRLADPASGPALRRTALTRPLDLLGLFLAGPDRLAALAGSGPPNSDDHPLVTLDAANNVRALSVPPTTLLLSLLHELGPDPAPLPGAPGAEPLAAYRRARNRFIEAGASLPPNLDERALMNAAIPGLLDAVRLSPDFDPAYMPLLAMVESLLGTNDTDDRDAAIHLLRAMRQAAPARVEAGHLLARLVVD